jgi:hypothetical protein
MSSIVKATEFKKDVPLDSIFPRVGNIRRLIKPQVKAAIAATIIANNGLPNEFALILRPVGDRFEAIAGNTRLSICNELKDGNIPEWYSVVSNASTGNVFTGFKTVPAFVKHLTDEETFFESARANAQGELTALEYGFGALLIPESKGGRGREGNISRYASDIGEPVGTVRRWRTAAEVLQELELGDRLEEFNSKTTHLAWVNTAPKEEWRSLVEKIANGITVDALRELLPSNKKAAIALKSNIQESFETTVDADDAESFLESTLGSAISNQQTDEGGDRAEVARIESEMAELRANSYSKMAEAESEQPVKNSSNTPKKSSASKALHSSASQESYTPLEIWKDVAYVFGAPVELDAATCEAARSATPTEKYFTKENDGLSQLWECDNFIVNPPGGKKNQELRTDPETGEVKLVQWGDSNQFLWYSKAEAEYLDGNARQGIYVAFNDALRAMAPSVHNYPICWVNSSATSKCVKGGRLCFDRVDENGDRVSQNSPTHSNFFVFFPPNLENSTVEEVEDCKAAITRFKESFKKYGTVTVPEHWRNL